MKGLHASTGEVPMHVIREMGEICGGQTKVEDLMDACAYHEHDDNVPKCKRR